MELARLFIPKTIDLDPMVPITRDRIPSDDSAVTLVQRNALSLISSIDESTIHTDQAFLDDVGEAWVVAADADGDQGGVLVEVSLLDLR